MNNKFIALLALALVITAAVLIFVFADDEDEVLYEPPDDLAKVVFGSESTVSFDCEVSDTDDERAIGLMDREELANDRGMLFVFDENSTSGFWMKNTTIPLDIIFIAENGTVINVEEAIVEEPGTPDSDHAHYYSDAPYKWVVEINKGLSQLHGIGPGTQVDIEL